MNWYYIGTGVSYVAAVVSFVAFIVFVSSLQKVTVGENSSRFIAVVFSLLGYYVVHTQGLPGPSNRILFFVAPGLAGVFGLWYLKRVAQDYQNELKDFIEQNKGILWAIGSLIICQVLLRLGEWLYAKAA